jgi:outer membrane protein TolC
MRKLFGALLLFGALYHTTYAQDTLTVFSQKDLLYYLTNYHPISKQAALQIKRGENELLKTRGVFDPVLFLNLDQKQFNEQEYFNLFSGGLKVPTWYGIDFKTGYDQNKGAYLDPQNKTPLNGLFFAGVSVPIGQGLLIDKRRAAIKQAELYAQSTFAEQKLTLNNLFYEATIEYLKWVNNYSELQLYQNAADLANVRFKGIKQSFLGGDVPAIDTLEAFIQVQVREVSLNQAKLSYQNAGLDLSSYLWFENNIPLEITNKLKPPAVEQLSVEPVITMATLNAIIEKLKINHPALQLYSFKLKQLDVERRWNTEQLKPKLNLNYNLINEPVNGNTFSGISTNNYKWGLDFSIPIFLRESRGRLNLTKIKIQETQFDVEIKTLELSNKIKSYYNELLALEQQIKLFSNATANYFTLLEAEKRKFFIGESSIFLINNRESAYVQAAIKLIELKIKYQSAIAKFKLAGATWLKD